MKILVCISSVPDTTSKINFTAGGESLDKNGIQFVINPLDEFALSRAIQLQTSVGADVTVVNVGPAENEPIIRKALATGANQAIRVNLDPQDSFSTAKALAQVAGAGSYDLILCGKESIDYNGGSVPGMLAGLLNSPFVNACVGLEVEESQLKAVREIEGGKETISVKLPAVIAGQKGLVDEKEVIIPNIRGIMGARSKPLEVVEPQQNEVRVKAETFERVAPRAAVKLVSPDNLDELVRLLHEEAKVI